jgi:hypothetical protein
LENFSRRFQDLAEGFADSGVRITTHQFSNRHTLKGTDMKRKSSTARNRPALWKLSQNLRVACALALGAALLAAGAPVAAAPSQSDESLAMRVADARMHADAIEALLTHRYAAAYGRFAQLADQGHVPSALIALMMVRHGQAVFGSEWSVTPEQLERWSAMAAQDLRERGALTAENDRGE